jgi:NAD(P)-dependent dehydrogenase (short-subunit alcohol dehydrogenase family)
MVDTLSLEGKVAIITGSGRETGIGAATAIALARNGASVTLNYVSDATAPRTVNVLKSLHEAGGKAIAVRADVTKPEEAKRLVDETLKGFNTDKIDILSELHPCAESYLGHCQWRKTPARNGFPTVYDYD